MSVQVSEFRHIPGKNDAEYIKLLKEAVLLKEALERQKQITSKAIAKIKELSKSEIPNGWISCDERLPKEDVEVLITYRYKKGEGDTSHTHIEITTYGQMYFGGNRVGNEKHWRQPFKYFESNYEVIAWMPLPEPYKEEK